MSTHFVPERIQRAWLARLALSFRGANRQYLEGKLKDPQFALLFGKGRAGSYDPRTRTIAIGVNHIIAAPDWTAVVVTLKHEMAHQVVHELWQTAGAEPHGELFARACRQLGLDEEGMSRTLVHSPAETKAIERIRKLLSLAQSHNKHEAELAMTMASRMLLKHNLSLAELAAKDGYVARRMGPVLPRIPLEHKQISSILAQHFFVRCLWINTYEPRKDKEGSVLEVMGWPHNVELAEHIHGYLLASLDRLWERFRAGKSFGVGDVRAARNAFRTGVLATVAERLATEQTVHREEGLVWVGDPGLAEFFERRHPRTRSLAGGRLSDASAMEAGRRAGRKLALRPALGDGPAASGGRSLPPKRGR
jgi:hypothetical protein